MRVILFKERTIGYIVYIFIINFFITISCSTTDSNENKDIKAISAGQVNWVGHWRDEGQKGQFVREIANEFEFLNQDIKVNLQFPEDLYQQGNDDDISFAIKMLKSPNPKWDIIRLKNNYVPISKILNDPDWAKKYLVDFSEMPDFVNSHLPIVFSTTFKSQNGGITIGPYTEGYFYSVWYNKDLADKMGIKIKDFGMTPEDFLGYIKAAFDYNQKNNTNIIPLFENELWLTTENLMVELFYSACVDFDEIVNVNFNPKKLIYLEKVLKVFEDISKYRPLPKNRSEIVFEKTMDYPLTGKCLLYINASWMYNDWENIDKVTLLKMYPAELPTFGSKNICYNGGYQACWAVLKNAPNRDNAIKLMKYWTRTDVSEKWVRFTKSPTAIKGNLTSVTLGFNQFENFEYTMNLKYGAHILAAYDNRYILGIQNKDIKIPFIEILENKITANQAIQNIRRQLKQ